MYDTIDLVEKLKKGANGDVLSAVDACKIIVDEKVFQVVPVLSTKPYKSYRPDDKGKKMTAAKGGPCKACGKTIEIGSTIYFKSGYGASHATCVDSEFIDDVKKMAEIDDPPPF